MAMYMHKRRMTTFGRLVVWGGARVRGEKRELRGLDFLSCGESELSVLIAHHYTLHAFQLVV
jgi:hypothetical protein